MALVSSRRPRTAFVVVGVLVFFVFILTLGRYRSPSWTSHLPNPPAALDTPFRGAQIRFWQTFNPTLQAYAPQCPSPVRLDVSNSPLDSRFGAEDLTRPNLLSMSGEDVNVMRQAHSGFVEQILRDGPKLVYKPGSRGIVSTAGGIYLPVMVISLRMLRKTGSTLPVEVFLSSAEFEPLICDTVFPSLNARCVVLSDIVGSEEISHYQFKIYSILFSSFEDVLFLDSDSFPVYDPEPLFTSEPFTETGLVLWPDFWYMSESHFYFEISSQASPSLSERAATEAGELLYSKPKHAASLLLATYYNMYGPSHYFRLLSQGAPGEGDKETFPWAAKALGEPYYYVREPVRSIGYLIPEKNIVDGSAMVQYDPRDDFLDSSQPSTDPSHTPSAKSLFVHANFPKFNPATIFQDEIDGVRGPTKNADGTFRRVWKDREPTISGFGLDIERRFWGEIKATACELEDKFDSWKEYQGICAAATEYWTAVFEPA